MPKYDYYCEHDGIFTVETSIHDKKDSYPCPVCGQETSLRRYEPTVFRWQINSPKEIRGVYKLEQDYEKQKRQLLEETDKTYETRSKMGTKAWREAGGEEAFWDELASQRFAKPKIISSTSGITGGAVTE
jgi:putative FmdB family regulatory protein